VCAIEKKALGRGVIEQRAIVRIHDVALSVKARVYIVYHHRPTTAHKQGKKKEEEGPVVHARSEVLATQCNAFFSPAAGKGGKGKKREEKGMHYSIISVAWLNIFFFFNFQ